jgi:LacI family transcriptional regulator
MTTVTIKDVAARAQVSWATVSRVLNNNPSVDDALRSRVLEAVQSLGYQPNPSARRLRRRSSDVVGLLISDIQNPFFLSIIRGVEDAAYAHQFSIVLCNSDEDQPKQQRYLHVMAAERVGGIIISPTFNTDAASLDRLSKAGIPIVVLDRLIDGLASDTVKVNNVQGARDAVQHLLGLGYRRIGLINGPLHLTTGQERFQGYQAAHQAAGLAVSPALVRFGDFRAESGYQLTRELVHLPERPDALFVGNNLMTLGALRALRESGLRVPQDMPVLGFDDMPWSSELSSPLTAISQPTFELGQEAVNLLQRRLTDPDAPYRTVVLQTRLIVRESCGARLRQS